MLNVKLELLCNVNRLGQRTELVVTLFQLILIIALCHYSTTRLEPEFAVSANEGSYHDGLIQVAVQTDKTDTASVGTAVVRLQL